MKKSPKTKRLGDSTLAIHAWQEKFHIAGSVGVDVSRTANFTFSSTEEMKRWAEGKSSAYIYTRYGNPTLTIAEKKIAALEGAEAAVVAASGMAAISTTLLTILRAGDEIIATRQLYGGAYRLMRDEFPRLGIVVRHVETDLGGIEKLVNPRTKALYVESPTNPVIRLVDLQKAIRFAKEWDLISLVDNTFASPVLQKPIQLGFDIVLHSATKYLSGHSDLIAGVAVGCEAWMKKIRHSIIDYGGSMDPEAAYLLIRGLKTLGVRVERQCKNAMIVAKYLAKNPKVARVNYPGLPSHPDHALARRQMKGFGGMLAFDLGSLDAARNLLNHVCLLALAESLGGVETLISHPAMMTHASVPPDRRAALGITDGLVRISAGVEDIEDLREDLAQALEHV